MKRMLTKGMSIFSFLYIGIIALFLMICQLQGLINAVSRANSFHEEFLYMLMAIVAIGLTFLITGNIMRRAIHKFQGRKI